MKKIVLLYLFLFFSTIPSLFAQSEPPPDSSENETAENDQKYVEERKKDKNFVLQKTLQAAHKLDIPDNVNLGNGTLESKWILQVKGNQPFTYFKFIEHGTQSISQNENEAKTQQFCKIPARALVELSAQIKEELDDHYLVRLSKPLVYGCKRSVGFIYKNHVYARYFKIHPELKLENPLSPNLKEYSGRVESLQFTKVVMNRNTYPNVTDEQYKCPVNSGTMFTTSGPIMRTYAGYDLVRFRQPLYCSLKNKTVPVFSGWIYKDHWNIKAPRFVYDEARGRLLAKKAWRLHYGGYTDGGCWEGVAASMDAWMGKRIQFPIQAVPSAHMFGVWALEKPYELCKLLHMKLSIQTTLSMAPEGALIWHRAGHCGFNATDGHIEVKVTPRITGLKKSMYVSDGPLPTEEICPQASAIFLPVAADFDCETLR